MAIDPMSVNGVLSGLSSSHELKDNISAQKSEKDAHLELPSEKVDISNATGTKGSESKHAKKGKAARQQKQPQTSKKQAAKKPIEIKMEKPSGNIATLSMIDGEGVMAKTAFNSTGASGQYMISDSAYSGKNVACIDSVEGKPEEPYRFSVKMNNLSRLASNGPLDMYLLVSSGPKSEAPGKAWGFSVGGYDHKHYGIYDSNGILDRSLISDIKFNFEKSSVEFAIDKKVMRQKGWKDKEEINLETFSTKDSVQNMIKSFEPNDESNNHASIMDAGISSSSLFGTLSADPSLKLEPKHTDWKDDMIYFILTDRFNDADKTNNFGVDKTNLNKFHGGDLQGVIDKLDYIKNLGVSSIWITPVMKNQDTFIDTDGYHGYWPVDFYNVDKHLGDMTKFEELIKKSHEKGLKVILDIPLNHTAWEHPIALDKEKYNWFHHNGDVKNWDDPWQAENCSIFGLPDLAQENPEVEKYLLDTAKFWVDKGIDGFRLDAVKNVPLSFWTKFSNEIHKYAGDNFLLVGEYFDGNPNKLVPYQKNDIDGLFDYPLHFVMKDVFAYGMSMRKLAGHLEYENKTYPNPELMSSFLDNHDTKRFLTEAGNDKSKFKLALACIMTLNRLPTFYYGTEVGMDSNSNNNGWMETSRKDMEWDKDPELLGYFKNLSSIRNNTPALTQGSFKEMWQDDQIFSYSRMMPDQEAIVVLNNGTNYESRDIPLRAESGLPEGTRLKDMLSDTVVTVKDRKLHIEMNGKQARIFTKI